MIFDYIHLGIESGLGAVADGPVHVIEDVKEDLSKNKDDDEQDSSSRADIHHHKTDSLDDDESQVKSMWDDQDEHDAPAFWRRLRGKKND